MRLLGKLIWNMERCIKCHKISISARSLLVHRMQNKFVFFAHKSMQWLVLKCRNVCFTVRAVIKGNINGVSEELFLKSLYIDIKIFNSRKILPTYLNRGRKTNFSMNLVIPRWLGCFWAFRITVLECLILLQHFKNQNLTWLFHSLLVLCRT